MDKEHIAKRILKALGNSTVPISWHCINEDKLVKVIERELKIIEKEETNA